MLKFFESKGDCYITFEYPLTNEDIENLEVLLNKKYLSWHIEFYRIYTVDKVIVDIFYKEIVENHKNIRITTYKNKLNRYFNRLGFNVKFESLLTNSRKLDKIDVILFGGSSDLSKKVIDIVKESNFENSSFVVTQYIKEDIETYTNNKVIYVNNGDVIQKGYIYISPLEKVLEVKDGKFVVTNYKNESSLSLCYESFSKYFRENLLIINESESKFKVQNQLNFNIEDCILNLNDIILYIEIINKNIDKELWIEYLLDIVYKKYNYDFRFYHRDMIHRRIDRYMSKYSIKSMREVVGMILFNRSAFKAFFLEVSINVTEFFRKPESFKNTIKFLTKYHKNSYNIKVWSAGCSSGEEVYSMAILLDRLGFLNKSIIYATDFNNVILEEAKNGIYSKESYILAKNNFKTIFTDRTLDDYVLQNNNYIVIKDEIKKKTLFFQHNLIEDSSFNEFNIIICKNVLIYFDYSLQLKVFQLFYDSLTFGGHLILGESESIVEEFTSKFQQCSENCKVFKKVA